MSRSNSLLRGGALAASLMLAAGGASPRAEAVVVNLDFGSTAINTASVLRAPYHGVTGDTGNISWNTSLGKNDISAGSLVYGNGATASALSVNIGITSETSSLSVLETQPSDSSGLGTTINAGVYAGNSPAKDAIFEKGGNGKRGITMQISGLDAGTYDIYYVGRNTNLSVGAGQQYTQSLFAGSSVTTGNFDYSSYAKSVITYGPASNANNGQSTWVLGEDYAMLTLTVAPGDAVNLAFIGEGIEPRGFLNALQIVSTSTIPEPAAFALLATGCLAIIGRRSRHHR